MKRKEINHVINYYYWLVLGLFLVVLISITSCSVAQSGGQGNESVISVTSLPTATTATVIPPTATLAPSATQTQTVTATPSPSGTPSATATFTPSPSVTLPSIPTSAPTLTPLPTVLPQQRGQVYSELMDNNGGCPLPCWWGFEMGATRIEDVIQLYMTFDTVVTKQTGNKGISAYYITFADPQIENGAQVDHIFIARDDIVIEALIDADDPSYQIEPLLQKLGEPTDIWMWTIPEPYQGILPARFRLYFPERGVFVLYATGGMKVDDNVQVCFDELGGVTLLLWDPVIWDPNGTKGIVDRSNEGGTAFTLEGFPIEEVSNWDAEQFYTILTDPTHSECLETPSNLWPPP